MLVSSAILLIGIVGVLVWSPRSWSKRTVGIALGSGLALFAASSLSVSPPAPAAPNSASDESLTVNETNALRGLHRTTVEIFIDQPGFGVRRMLLPLEDVVHAPKSLAEQLIEQAKSNENQNLSKDVPQQGQPASKPKQPHFAVAKTLAVFGRFPASDRREQWTVSKVQLVGLVTHPDPVVYLADHVPNMKDMKEGSDIPTRALDDFEKAALQVLQSGEDQKFEKHGKELRLLAPIYAGKRCTACHEKGQMLGAFSYQLARGPIKVHEPGAPLEHLP